MIFNSLQPVAPQKSSEIEKNEENLVHIGSIGSVALLSKFALHSELRNL